MTLRSFFLRLPIVLLVAHAYVAWRLASAFSSGHASLLAVIAITMIYGLVLAGFALRRSAGRAWGDALAWCGFLALGLFSWLFVLTLLRDAALLGWALLALLGGPAIDPHGYAASGRAIPIAATLAALWGLFNARRIAPVKRVDIRLPGLPAAFDGFVIAQISDLHVGPTIKRDYVHAVVERVNELQADAVAVTGDIVDGSVDRLAPHTQPLGSLRGRHGVFAVTGNHEYYSGAASWVAELRRLGLTVLQNQHVVIERGGARLVIAGVTDYNAASFDTSQATDPVRALRDAPADTPRILLAHQPRSAAAAEAAGADLQLSGHTHGGQFLPWNLFVPMQQPFVAGLHRHGRLQVYVSRGTGYWGPPLRLGARSEITRIRLLAA